MKSIRLSLMVYFLSLLALALGAASWFVYETAFYTLRDKQRTMEQLVDEQYKKRCSDEEQKLDDRLLWEATTLHTLVKSRLDMTRIRLRNLNLLNIGGLAGSQATPNIFTAPFWLLGSTYTPGPEAPRLLPPDKYRLSADLYKPYYDDFWENRKPAFQFNEDDLMRNENHIAEYIQINAEWVTTYRSLSLEKPGDVLPLDSSLFERDRALSWKWDEVTLEHTGIKVRRIALKAPAATLPNLRQFGRGGALPTPPLPLPGTEVSQRPPLYIQCAYKADLRDAKLQEFTNERDEKKAELKAETQASLNNLSRRLLITSLATFAATVAGTWFLVWLGLSPLQRLSVAVSRVSERDFRLQFDEPRLPSELQPIVERLTDTLEQLKRAFAREKQATADISHELRTPLAALLTTTEVALRKPRAAEEYRELLEDCRLSGQQMNRAVERLLALARLDAGVDHLRPEKVDVAVLAEQCAAVVRPLAEARGLNLKVHGSDGAQLLADPNKLREVITNLLHNAIQYNRPRGTIDVSVARENGHLHVEVRDTGIGIAPEAKQHIFERFYRADPSRGDDMHAGLGLAIVKGYVDLMGGTIHVESAEGEGSTFHVHLPVDRARSAGDN